MTRPSALIVLLLAGLALVSLLAPAASPAEEAAPTATTTEIVTSTAPTETPAPAEATTPSASAPTTTAQSPAPGTTTTAPPATAPKVSGQSAQGATPSPAGQAGNAGAKSTEGGATGKPKRGKKAPKPSALTPPLPLSLSSSIAGVPAFFIESFRIPPFLLPIYQAAGTAYGMPWQLLAAINEVETDYGRDLNVSTAGAEGWMQFLPSSWATYGVDANGDGFKDPYNPADAIFAAARYLRAAGAATSLRGAVFSYNHSRAYVESVMLRAKLLGGTPSGLLGAITGLTEARFPVHAKAHFSDGFPTVAARASNSVKSLPGTVIYSEAGAPVIAVQDGEVVQIGDSTQLGRFVSLRDAYGNTYTYAKLASVAQLYPVLRPHDGQTGDKSAAKAQEPAEPRPAGPASAGTQAGSQPPAGEEAGTGALSLGSASALEATAPGSTAAPAPGADAAPSQSPAPAAGAAAPSGESAGTSPSSEAQATPGEAAPPSGDPAQRVFRDGPNDVYLHELHTGARVIAGTVLGHVGDGEGGSEGAEPHMLFQIRPAGVGAPQIDPKPILDGWVQLENSSVFRAKGQNPFLATAPTVGQVLLESKEQLQQQVLANPDIDIYPCGRQDIQTGQIDRRVLATLEFLAVSELKPTVSALKCGHSDLTTEGNVSEHSTGDAVDISADQRHPDRRPPGPGVDHRHDDPQAADLAGVDEAAPDHQPDDLPRRRQHARDGRPLQPHPRGLQAVVRPERQPRRLAQLLDHAEPVDQADRPPG